MTDKKRGGLAESAAFELSHQMLVLDAGLGERLDSDRFEQITRGFVGDLLNALGMEPLADLGIYPAVDLRAPGWSFIQPITTSHVSAHYFEKPGRLPHIRLDAYSCESVDWRRIIQVCDRHFRLDEWRATFIDRQIEPRLERPVYDIVGVGARVTSEHPMYPATHTNLGDVLCR